MSWYALELVLARARLDEAAAVLFEAGCAGLQEDHLPGEAPRHVQVWEDRIASPTPSAELLLRAWFEDPAQRAIDERLAGHGLQGTWSELPDVPWEESWKEGHQPIEVSPRITIAPPWCGSEQAVLIEPGQGFGTGQHPTTRAVLRALDDVTAAEPGLRTLLDVGCGSGVVALAAARLGLTCRGVDIDQDAVDEAVQNAARNGLDVSFSTTPLHEVVTPADVVVLNAHPGVHVALAAHVLRLTRRWLLLGGIVDDHEQRVRAAYEAAGRPFEVTRREQDGGWVSLRLAAGE
jgi:ribosomal protein L11 methyltransferase